MANQRLLNGQSTDNQRPINGKLTANQQPINHNRTGLTSIPRSPHYHAVPLESFPGSAVPAASNQYQASQQLAWTQAPAVHAYQYSDNSPNARLNTSRARRKVTTDARVHLRARTQPMTRAPQGTAYASLGRLPPLANHECQWEARSHPHEQKLPALTVETRRSKNMRMKRTKS